MQGIVEPLTEFVGQIVQEELKKIDLSGYPENLNMTQAVKFSGVNKDKLKNILYYYRDEVEVSMKNPRGFVVFPEGQIWSIHRDKFKRWMEENQHKMKGVSR